MVKRPDPRADVDDDAILAVPEVLDDVLSIVRTEDEGVAAGDGADRHLRRIAPHDVAGGAAGQHVVATLCPCPQAEGVPEQETRVRIVAGPPDEAVVAALRRAGHGVGVSDEGAAATAAV